MCPNWTAALHAVLTPELVDNVVVRLHKIAVVVDALDADDAGVNDCAGAAEMLDGGAAAIEKANNKAGLVAQAAVKNTLRAGEGFPPLADATLAARKRAGFTGTKPLIWTGQLLNSVTYVIRKRNG